MSAIEIHAAIKIMGLYLKKKLQKEVGLPKGQDENPLLFWKLSYQVIQVSPPRICSVLLAVIKIRPAIVFQIPKKIGRKRASSSLLLTKNYTICVLLNKEEGNIQEHKPMNFCSPFYSQG